MKIEHMAIYVNDIEGAKQFFVEYFGATANDKYENQTTGFQSYFLSFEDGARIEIMNRPDMENQEKSATQTGFSHLAFSVGSKEVVDKMTERFRADGYEVASGPRTTGDGYYESCIVGFEGNIFEITV
ncbi:MAG: VOC family protein [Bacillota bacterium]